MTDDGYTVRVIGRIRSSLTDPAGAPRQPDEGAPTARIDLDPEVRPAAADLRAGDRVLVLTFLDRADRGVLRVHPRGDPAATERGVFSTRSQHRPNPIGLHEVTITGTGGGGLEVDGIEAVDGTPVLDIKPVLGGVPER